GADQTAFDIAEDLYQGALFFGTVPQLVQQIVTHAQAFRGQDPGVQAQGISEGLGDKLLKSMFSVVVVAGLVCSIYAISDWDSLPPDQQAAACVNLAAAIFAYGQAVPDIINTAAWATKGLADLMRPAAASPAVMDALAATQTTLLIQRDAQTTTFFGWLAPRFDSATRELKTAGTQVAAFFKIKIVANFIKGISALFAAAAFAISVWTLV